MHPEAVRVFPEFAGSSVTREPVPIRVASHLVAGWSADPLGLVVVQISLKGSSAQAVLEVSGIPGEEPERFARRARKALKARLPADWDRVEHVLPSSVPEYSVGRCAALRLICSEHFRVDGAYCPLLAEALNASVDPEPSGGRVLPCRQVERRLQTVVAAFEIAAYRRQEIADESRGVARRG